MRSSSEENHLANLTSSGYTSDEREQKKPRTSLQIIDYSNPFAVRNLLEDLDCGKYGSVTKEINDLLARKRQMLNPYFAMHPTLVDLEVNLVKEVAKVNQHLATPLACRDVIELDDDDTDDVSAERLAVVVHRSPVVAQNSQVVVLDSDDEDTEDRKPFNSYQQIILPKPPGEFLMKDFLMKDFLVIAFYTSEL